jgi:hypothetical protein
MKIIQKIKSLLRDSKNFFLKYKERLANGISQLKTWILDTWKLMEQNPKEKTRIAIIALSVIFLLDYVFISIHMDKNIFDIFPSLPAIESKDKIKIYIPSEGCKEIISEYRTIDKDIDEDTFVSKLLSLVAEGSWFENTSSNVPVNLLVKKVWFIKTDNGRVCLIDILPVVIEKDITIVPGSEKMFIVALEKTIKENIPDIQSVLLTEGGVPGKKFWEIN